MGWANVDKGNTRTLSICRNSQFEKNQKSGENKGGQEK